MTDKLLLLYYFLLFLVFTVHVCTCIDQHKNVGATKLNVAIFGKFCQPDVNWPLVCLLFSHAGKSAYFKALCNGNYAETR